MSGHAGDAGPGQVAPIGYQYNDGGRAAAGYKGTTGDCVCPRDCHRDRASLPGDLRPHQRLRQARAQGEAEARAEQRAYRGPQGHHSPRDRGELGWVFVPTMGIGTGCRVHLRADELPRGRLIVNFSRHMSAVIDGVVHDIHDPCRDGTRCVYGYWFKVDDTTPAQLDLFDTCGVR